MDEVEVVANLWWVLDEQSGLVYRLAGRAYVMSGTEAHKISLLRALSTTDYLAAQMFQVPMSFIVTAGEETRAGYCLPSTIADYKEKVFAEVLEQLDKTMPLQASFTVGQEKSFRMKLPENPLCITTPLIEDEDGVIKPQVKQP